MEPSGGERRELYQLSSSPYCRKVRWCLARKRLAFTVHDADGDGRAALVRVSGQGRVPVLVDGADVVGGSTTIAFHLERLYAEPSLFPTDARKRNQAVTFDEFADRAIGWPCLRLRKLDVEREIDAEGAPPADDEVLVAELRQGLGQVREAVGRKALDSGACHLGDIAVAAHLVSCRDVSALDYDDSYADLREYGERIRALCGVDREEE